MEVDATERNHLVSSVSAAIVKKKKRLPEFSGRTGMRQPIETVPKDGRAVILEDDSTGTYELARWSAQESAWVGENAKPCNIAPRYWHTMRRAEHRENECQPKNPLQPSAAVTDVNGPEIS